MIRPELLWGGDGRLICFGEGVVKKSHIILAALFIYLAMLVAGGAVYYAHRQRPPVAPVKTPDAVTMKTPSAEDQAAAKQAEAEQQKAKQQEQRIETLKAGLKVETIHGVTYYRYDWPQRMPTGVYLRPYIAVGSGRCILKNDVCYSYSIDDPQKTAWINGDRLDIIVGGQRTTLVFDPGMMHKQMAPDAEWLMEDYVMDADAVSLAVLRQLAVSSYAEVVYYRHGGKSRQQILSAEELERIRVMVDLYELLAAQE